MLRLLLFFGLSLSWFLASGQISEGGMPYGKKHQLAIEEIPLIKVQAPEYRNVDASSEGKLKPLLAGESVSYVIDVLQVSSKVALKKETIYHLRIQSKDASAIGLEFSDFYLPEGARIFVYKQNSKKVLGAYTSLNNRSSGLFAIEPLKGSEIVLECILPEKAEQYTRLKISGISYIFNATGLKAGFGDSDFCEVNVNCPEGAGWQDEKKGIARILLKDGSQYFYCTGSLVNNTALDNTPYFLTANHCGKNSSDNDYQMWIFYFNYESETCETPAEEPDANTISGALLRAKTENNESLASDFKLLEFTNNVPESYQPYFNGWNRSNGIPASGKGIHHPQGDIKKISTFTTAPISTSWEGSTSEPEEKYFKLRWAETQTNHGVTEGGSSGSPIFNEDSEIVGTLTGGTAKCDAPNAPDYYGKFWYHWDKNGPEATSQLKPWLDPENLEITSLKGMGVNEDILLVLFKSSLDTIQVGGSVDFEDLSSGGPTSWEWHFEGAEPEKSQVQNPQNIVYPDFGKYNVSLIISKEGESDTLLKNDFIYVKPLIGPNPSKGRVEVFLGQSETNRFHINIFDMMGRKALSQEFDSPENNIVLELDDLSVGFYVFELIRDDFVSTHKIILM